MSESSRKPSTMKYTSGSLDKGRREGVISLALSERTTSRKYAHYRQKGDPSNSQMVQQFNQVLCAKTAAQC